jgi:hypothetical protein
MDYGALPDWLILLLLVIWMALDRCNIYVPVDRIKAHFARRSAGKSNSYGNDHAR